MSGLALAGVLFSGSLSAVHLVTRSCAFHESRPFFLGYPTYRCGFAMFAAIFAAALVSYPGNVRAESAAKIIAAISLLGTVVAGRFVWIEGKLRRLGEKTGDS